MNSRRDFLKKSLFLTGSVGMADFFSDILQKAMSIDPKEGSTYLDAEHIVILMQENRSFDHCFGTLKGVRGVSDPRAIDLPNENPVWFQQNEKGETYAPFRMKMFDSKSTWMGDLPHGRHDQVDAFNKGKHNKWLDSKKSRHPQGKDMPLTMGFYTREDLPFHHALAEAFTICDQNFCSANTSTTPNRSYFWTGNIKSSEGGWTKMNIRNTDYTAGKHEWETMPEQLERNDISWKFYQNDLSTGGGYSNDERAWLANFGCNLLEYFERFNVKFNDRYIKAMHKQVAELPEEIILLKEKLVQIRPDSAEGEKIKKSVLAKEKVLNNAEYELYKWGASEFGKLSSEEKSLFRRAFSTNSGDVDFRSIDKLAVEVGGEKKQVSIPKGDLFYQFRKDVENGELPAVSWFAAPQNFSDHPSAPWYGAWYVSQIMEILTKNPEVWKKTIFIMTYDENDGYYDHIPPFIPPDPRRPETGKCSEGIDTEEEWVRLENELRQGIEEKNAREAPIGLGYRVPMIIASPWSRGGNVCSQVFDHTSTLQFLEKWASEKWSKDIRLTGMTSWRRAVCGNLTSVFQPFDGNVDKLPFLNRNQTISEIFKAQFKELPKGFQQYGQDEIDRIKRNPKLAPWRQFHEKGVRPARPIPYELYSNGHFNRSENKFELRLEASQYLFQADAVGSPFTVYAAGKYEVGDNKYETGRIWSYAVTPGDQLIEYWSADDFQDKYYHLKVAAPNGFFREFKGDQNDPAIFVECKNEWVKSGERKLTGNIQIVIENEGGIVELEITDNAYGNKPIVKRIKANEETIFKWSTAKSYNWYDFTVKVKGNSTYFQRFAGHIETGEMSYSDPAMGNLD